MTHQQRAAQKETAKKAACTSFNTYLVLAVQECAPFFSFDTWTNIVSVSNFTEMFPVKFTGWEGNNQK